MKTRAWPTARTSAPCSAPRNRLKEDHPEKSKAGTMAEAKASSGFNTGLDGIRATMLDEVGGK